MAKPTDTQTRPGRGSTIKKTLKWGSMGVILIGASAGTTLYLSGALDGLGGGGVTADVDGARPVSPAPAQYMPLDPPFVVNFDDQGMLRYLQVNVSVMTRNKDVLEAVRTHIPHIRYNLIVLFGSQDFATLRSTEGKEKLRALALEEIQSVLHKEIGSAAVEAVYFTNFVMQ